MVCAKDKVVKRKKAIRSNAFIKRLLNGLVVVFYFGAATMGF
jgi:hypothetical protein